jgi:outer membrane lipoprotein SlyB
MPSVTAQEILAGVALVIMGAISGALIIHAVPQGNMQLITFALGAISGALTVSGGSKIADKLTTSTGPGATIQADAPPPATPETH